jgi:hypothetical protein
MFGAQAAALALNRHWTPVPLQSLVAVFYCFGLAFSMSVVVWLYYLGLEPYVRRRWPFLLVSWTRLLEGRWRDPLVGRAVLSGTTMALWVAAIVPGLFATATRWLSWPIAVPWGQSQLAPFPQAIAALLGDHVTGFLGVFNALFALVVLVLARVVSRRNGAAWAVVVAVFIAAVVWSILIVQPYALTTPAGPVLIGVVFSSGLALTLGRYGLLGAMAFAIVSTALLNTPLTADPSRWYAWRTLAVGALVVGLAVWGFRNVLGRQTALPGGMLDE